MNETARFLHNVVQTLIGGTAHQVRVIVGIPTESSFARDEKTTFGFVASSVRIDPIFEPSLDSLPESVNETQPLVIGAKCALRAYASEDGLLWLSTEFASPTTEVRLHGDGIIVQQTDDSIIVLFGPQRSGVLEIDASNSGIVFQLRERELSAASVSWSSSTYDDAPPPTLGDWTMEASRVAGPELTAALVELHRSDDPFLSLAVLSHVARLLDHTLATPLRAWWESLAEESREIWKGRVRRAASDLSEQICSPEFEDQLKPTATLAALALERAHLESLNWLMNLPELLGMLLDIDVHADAIVDNREWSPVDAEGEELILDEYIIASAQTGHLPLSWWCALFDTSVLS